MILKLARHADLHVCCSELFLWQWTSVGFCEMLVQLRMAPWVFYFLFNLAWSLHGGLAWSPTNDVVLGGIFSEHLSRSNGHTHANEWDEHPCGEHSLRGTADRLAMEFAVSVINHSWDILPGIRVGTNIKDSCSDLDYAINNTLDYAFIRKRFVNKSFHCEGTETKCCVHGNGQSAPLVAIVAGAYSHIVKAIVNLVGLFKVPVIGYSSTSPSLNKMDYFLRTVAPDTVSTKVMVDLILQLDWNIVLLLYVDNEFGHYAADCFRMEIRRVEKKICIAFDDKFSTTSDEQEIKKIVQGIKKANRSRVIAYFGTVEDFVYFQEQITGMRDLNWDPNAYVWLSSELWLRSDLIRISPNIRNILTIIPEQGYRSRLFADYLRSRADVNITCGHVHRNTTYLHGSSTHNHSTIGNCLMEQSKYIPHVLDAVYSVAMALHNMLGCEAGKSCQDKLKTIRHRSLLEYLQTLSFFNNLTNQSIAFDSNGNPRSARYTVVKLSIGNGKRNNTDIGYWKCVKNTSYCTGELSPKISSVLNSSEFSSSCGPKCTEGEHKSVEDDYPDCCWTCRKCTGNKYSDTSGQLSCKKCSNDLWPNSNHTRCAEIEHDYLDVTQISGVMIVTWNCLTVALIIVVGVVFLKYSSSHIVRASSRHLSLLLLLGISIDITLLLTLLVEPNGRQCWVIFVLSHVAGCLITGTLFLKTNRIHRIFRKSAMTERPRCMGNSCQLLIILILVLIECALAISVLVLKPENGEVRVTFITDEESKKAFLLCSFFGKSFKDGVFHVVLWSYDCGMIFICTYQAYLVRKVPENYNEARYITFTMVTISVNIIVYVITTSGMDGKNLVLVYCIFQSLKASVALGCMFLPKIYIILFQPEKNVPHNPVKSKLGTFVEDNSVKPEDSLSSSSSIKPSESSESLPRASATGGRTYQEVGAKQSIKQSGVKFERVSKCHDLGTRKQELLSDTTGRVKGSADIVLENGSTTTV